MAAEYDVAVLGAGAAGMVAAARAAECGARVILLEKNRRAGVKILISGGTRCNITNARGLRRLDAVTGPIDPAFDVGRCRGIRAIQQAFGPGGAFLGPSLRRLDVDATIRLFEQAGVATKVEGNGKVFPASDRAVDVLAALVRRLEHSGASLRCHCPVMGIEPIGVGPGDSPGFAVRLPDSTIEVRRVIVTVGGRSYPGCGTTGDGYRDRRRGWATRSSSRGRRSCRSGWMRTGSADLRGVTLSDVVASVHAPGVGSLQDRREAVLFAHFGLTGPAILDVSRAVTRSDDPRRLGLRLDLIPDVPREKLNGRVQDHEPARPPAADVPPARRRSRVDWPNASSMAAGIPPDRMGPDLSRDERHRLVDALKGLSLPILGTLGFEKAEVTSGGVALDQVDPRTLESRLVPGLHFAGEVLDLDGLIGGYNFQAAWSTGWLAGEAAASSAKS